MAPVELDRGRPEAARGGAGPLAPLPAGPEVWTGPGPVSALPFRQRLSLSITLLIVLVALAGAVQAVRQARVDIQSELQSMMALTSHFLGAQLPRQSRTEGDRALRFELQGLDQARHLQVAVYDAQGRLLDHSASRPAHRTLAPGWFVWLMRRSAAPVAELRRPIEIDGVASGELAVTADPSYEIDEIWMSARGQILLLLLFCVLVNAMLWWTVSRAMRPVDSIIAALGELGRGRLQTRLPRFSLPEMSRISAGFNHMARTLQHSVDENTRLTRQLIQMQEDERGRLARELHDELGQCVSAIHADAVAIRRRGDASVRESAEAIVQVTATMQDLVRGMLRRLRPGALDQLGLDAALSDLVAGFRQRHPRASCTLDIAPRLKDLRGETAIAVYRMVQECLTNVSRHAEAHQVQILVHCLMTTDETFAAERLELSVRDDGRGMDDESSARGFGLLGMRERARVLGGDLVVDSAPGRGVQILAHLPVCGRVEEESE